MHNDMVVLLLQIAVLIAGYLAGKSLGGSGTDEAMKQLDLVSGYADAFVRYARQFMKTSTGAEKMEVVVDELIAICTTHGLNLDDLSIKAIVQSAYDAMKKEEG